MKKALYVLLTLPVCAVFGFTKLWCGFSAVYFLFLFKGIGKPTLWEIPMAILACSIVKDLTAGQTALGIRFLIPSAALLTAFFTPKKLLPFFAVSIVSLILRNDYGLSAIFAAMWCSGRDFIIRRQTTLGYSNTEKSFLQDCNREKYVEIPKKM